MKMLPEGWEEADFLRYMDLVKSGIREYSGLRKYVATGSLETGKIIDFVDVDFHRKPSRANLEVKEDDILFAKMKDTEKVYLVSKRDAENLYSTGFSALRVRDRDRVLPEYVFYWLVSSYFQNMKNEASTGATQKAIVESRLKRFKVILPPLGTQRRIVEILGKVNQVRMWKEEIEAMTDELLRSTFLDMFGQPLRNSKGWPTGELGEVASVERGKFTPRPRNDPSYYGGQYPFIQTGDISSSNGVLYQYTQTLNERGKRVSRLFDEATIVIAIVGATIGATAILDIPVYAPDSVVGIRVNQDKLTAEYVEYLLRFWKPIFLARAPETARANINLNTIRPLEIPIPPIQLQERFAEIYRQTVELRRLQEESDDHIVNFYESLMRKAFRGELVC